MSATDPMLLTIFAEEAEELLEASDEACVNLESEDQRSEAIDSLLRSLHTLKGAARTVGLSGMGDFTHAFESWLNDWKSIPAVQLSSVSRRALDSLHTMHDHVSAGGAPMASGAGFQSLINDKPATQLEAPEKPDPKATEQPHAARNLRIAANTIDELSEEIGIAASQTTAVHGLLEQSQTRLRDRSTSTTELITLAKNLQSDLAQQLRHLAQSNQRMDGKSLDCITRMQLTCQSLITRLNNDCTQLKIIRSDIESAIQSVNQHGQASTRAGQQLLSTRLIAFNEQENRLNRVVRQTAEELERKAALTMVGGDMLIDRTLSEKLLGPIEHLLRNSVAHGLEEPTKRTESGKSATGQLTISLSQSHGRITIEVSDDGRGIDVERIRKKAISVGLIPADTKLSETALQKLILEPGFSTANALSQVSGRGVGMDVVADAVRSLGGALDIESTNGKGATFTIRVPLNLASIDCLVVAVGSQPFGIPIDEIEAVHRLNTEQTMNSNYQWNQRQFEIHPLSQWLGRENENITEFSKVNAVLMAGTQPAAITVTQVLEMRSCLIKPLPPLLAGMPGLLAIGRDATGRSIMLLDIPDLLNRGPLCPDRPTDTMRKRMPSRTLLTVDDSPTVSAAVTSALRGRDWEVDSVSDGQLALDYLATKQPDLILLDIDMPMLDGIECLRRIRTHPLMSKLPVIMYTGSENKGREKEAMAAGANGFLTKTLRGQKFANALDRLFDQLGPVNTKQRSN